MPEFEIMRIPEVMELPEPVQKNFSTRYQDIASWDAHSYRLCALYEIKYSFEVDLRSWTADDLVEAARNQYPLMRDWSLSLIHSNLTHGEFNIWVPAGPEQFEKEYNDWQNSQGSWRLRQR